MNIVWGESNSSEIEYDEEGNEIIRLDKKVRKRKKKCLRVGFG